MLTVHVHVPGWLTRAQLLHLHGGNVAIVEAIIEAKVAIGHHKPHPDLPNDPEATLYYVS